MPERINLQEFTTLVYDACFFVKERPPKEDLKAIFTILDTNRDGYISLTEYMNFIRKYLGKGLQIVDEINPEASKKVV